MTRTIKLLAIAWLLGFLFSAPGRATTFTALTCSQTDVQATLNKAVDGDTVVIPAGMCTWTSTVTLSVRGALTIMGSGSQSVTGGGDVTVIVDSLPRTSGDVPMLQINTVSGKPFRLSGITFQGGSNGQTFTGSVYITGSTQQLRIDHVHFNKINTLANRIDGPVGVVDHCLYDFPAGNTNWNGTHVMHTSWGGHNFGDGSWADGPHYGTNQFMYFEDNISNYAFMNDCNSGGRMVFRHNTLNFSVIQTHEMSQRFRGCRVYEIYNNTWTGDSANPLSTAFFDTSGNGMFWGNRIQGYNIGVTVRVDRTGNVPYTMTPPPNGYGYCGISLGPSAWDQNTNSQGYPCLDQIGRGQGDLLSGDFPNAVNSVTGTMSWPRQAIEPVYEWNDVFTKSAYSTSQFWAASTPDLTPNQDYYLGFGTTSFNGTSGVGTGQLSSRPSTCTPYVAYWATDTNTLYQCSAANTWTAYYTPYTYPHPLTAASGAGIAPPTNLQALAQ